MNWSINNIQITNFKFFKEPFLLELKGNNLLMYGENGSGKSSIYWAFYTIFQSCFKDPTKEDAQKYFLADHSENLRNKFSKKDEGSSLKIELISKDGVTRQYTDSDEICNTHTADDTLMLLSAGSCDFLNYKFLSEILDFKNSEENDIFDIIESDILPSMVCSIGFSSKYVTSDKEKILAYWWKVINEIPKDLPKNSRQKSQFNQSKQEYKDFQSLIRDFNDEFENRLKDLVREANKKLKTKFKIPVEIELTPTKVEFNKRRANTRRGYDGIVHRPKVIITAKMTNVSLPDGPSNIPHPKSFFNEAKLTCIALAFRLAAVEMRYKGNDAVSALFIDDILISLDMGHRLKVVDILLELRKDHQLFIFTHDRAFYDIIATKIESLPSDDKWRWVKKEIYAQDEKMCIDGIPSHFLLKNEDYLERAEENLYRCDLPACANYLRKAAEYQLKRLFPSNWSVTTEWVSENGDRISHEVKEDLSGLIQQLPAYFERYSIPRRNSNLDIHRKRLLNPLSHDDLHTPIYRTELIDCMQELKWLSGIRKIEDVQTEDQIRNNYYCIEHKHKNRYAKIVFSFEEAYNHIEIDEKDEDGNMITKVYHSNSKFQVLWCTCPEILKDDSENDHCINGLHGVVLQFLGYKDQDAKPSFDELVKPYPKERVLIDILNGVILYKEERI